MLDSARIKLWASECGFSLCGIVRADESGCGDAFRSWLDKGYGSSLGYMERNVEKRLDPRLLVEGGRSVIVCAINYKNDLWEQSHDPSVPKVASYALARDYHTIIKGMLAKLFERAKEAYPDLEGRAFTDSAPVMEKIWAEKAGLGWRGRNSLLVTPGFGSFVLLGELIVNLEADVYDRPTGQDGCGNCSACVDNCPTGAICEDRTIDTRRCISRATMYPLDDDVSTRGWILGCDECQSCCPYNRRSPMHTNPLFDAVTDYRLLTPDFWQALDKEGFEDIFGQTPLADVKAIVARFCREKDS